MISFNNVRSEEWIISDKIDEIRRSTLNNPPGANDLINKIIGENELCCDHILENLWEDSTENPGFRRIRLTFSISRTTFDQFFNGRSGYRAQYYISPTNGIRYNDAVIRALYCQIESYNFLIHDIDNIRRSLLGSWSKLWVVGDGTSFADSPIGLEIARWNEYWHGKSTYLGLKIPCPEAPQLDLKGTFINFIDKESWIDEIKTDRADDLYKSGWC